MVGSSFLAGWAPAPQMCACCFKDTYELNVSPEIKVFHFSTYAEMYTIYTILFVESEFKNPARIMACGMHRPVVVLRMHMAASILF